jgi:hypothetical protein
VAARLLRQRRRGSFAGGFAGAAPVLAGLLYVGVCVGWRVGVCGALLAGCVLLAFLFGGLSSAMDPALGKVKVIFFILKSCTYFKKVNFQSL